MKRFVAVVALVLGACGGPDESTGAPGSVTAAEQHGTCRRVADVRCYADAIFQYCADNLHWADGQDCSRQGMRCVLDAHLCSVGICCTP